MIELNILSLDIFFECTAEHDNNEDVFVKSKVKVEESVAVKLFSRKKEQKFNFLIFQSSCIFQLRYDYKKLILNINSKEVGSSEKHFFINLVNHFFGDFFLVTAWSMFPQV